MPSTKATQAESAAPLLCWTIMDCMDCMVASLHIWDRFGSRLQVRTILCVPMN
jgi:hypothetical protein